MLQWTGQGRRSPPVLAPVLAVVASSRPCSSALAVLAVVAVVALAVVLDAFLPELGVDGVAVGASSSPWCSPSRR
jgi:hypothetical protein